MKRIFNRVLVDKWNVDAGYDLVTTQDCLRIERVLDQVGSSRVENIPLRIDGQDIYDGIKYSNEGCPVALALNRETKDMFSFHVASEEILVFLDWHLSNSVQVQFLDWHLSNSVQRGSLGFVKFPIFKLKTSESVWAAIRQFDRTGKMFPQSVWMDLPLFFLKYFA